METKTDAHDAADRWARTWARAWPVGDYESVAALYAAGATYRAHPMRGPVLGGALGYAREQFAVERAVQCWFGEPIADGDRAAVEWWASLREGEDTVTLAGATVLRFDETGQVREHVDYWVVEDGRQPPFPGWGQHAAKG